MVIRISALHDVAFNSPSQDGAWEVHPAVKTCWTYDQISHWITLYSITGKHFFLHLPTYTMDNVQTGLSNQCKTYEVGSQSINKKKENRTDNRIRSAVPSLPAH